MKRALVFWLLFACAISSSAVGQKVIDLENGLPFAGFNWKYRSGDRIEWAQPEWDDSSWAEFRFEKKPDLDEKYWIRTSFLVKGGLGETDVLGFWIFNLPTAYEIYWDGERIGGNGKIGSGNRKETSGLVNYYQRFPPQKIESGLHLLALRVSNRHGGELSLFSKILFAPHSWVLNLLKQRENNVLIDLGLTVTAAIFIVFLYLGGLRYSALVFLAGVILLWFIQSGWITLLYSSSLRTTAYQFFGPLISAADLLTFFLLCLFVLLYFEIKRKGIHILVIAAVVLTVTLLVPQMSNRITLRITFMVLYALGLSLSKWKVRNLSYVIAIAGLASLSLHFFIIALRPFFPAALDQIPEFIHIVLRIVFFACVMGSISFRLKEQLKKYQEIQLRSQRLETELLKKSIQPHFIMNTLLSIKSWLGRDSVKAEKLIEAFADEFRIINSIASKKKISIEEEISLCRYHLEIMGIRRDAFYTLKVNSLCKGETIPPMVFHTLIENGITHAFHPKENGEFHLYCTQNNREVVYCLRNRGSRISRFAGLHSEKIEEGMGLKYIKARLEESYPGKWSMHYGINDKSWEVCIGIQRG